MSCIITIEGNIGVGKSTFIKFLKETCINNKLSNIIFIEEPVDEWSNIEVNGITILEKFYEEQKKYAFTFQIMAFISRLVNIQKVIKENKNAIIVCERCLLTDKYVFAKMLYDINNINPYSYQVYNLWFDEFFNKLPKHKHIYLKSTPEVTKLRTEKRNRISEKDIDINYLYMCNSYHNSYFDNNKNLLLSVNMDNIELFSDDLYHPLNEEYKNIIDKIISIILNNNKSVYKISLLSLFSFLKIKLLSFTSFLKIKFLTLTLFCKNNKKHIIGME
jgi:deoxyadenosine/deoxycytidine kinase